MEEGRSRAKLRQLEGRVSTRSWKCGNDSLKATAFRPLKQWCEVKSYI